MTITTKFNKRDKVFLIKDGQVRQAFVLWMKIETGNLIGLPDPFVTCFLGSHPDSFKEDMGERPETEIFPTKEELLKSL